MGCEPRYVRAPAAASKIDMRKCSPCQIFPRGGSFHASSGKSVATARAISSFVRAWRDRKKRRTAFGLMSTMATLDSLATALRAAARDMRLSFPAIRDGRYVRMMTANGAYVFKIRWKRCPRHSLDRDRPHARVPQSKTATPSTATNPKLRGRTSTAMQRPLLSRIVRSSFRTSAIFCDGLIQASLTQ